MINTPKKKISARSINQAKFIEALKENIMTFGVGPAGTGKTYLAVADAVENMSQGKCRKDYIIKACCRSRRTIGVFTRRP